MSEQPAPEPIDLEPDPGSQDSDQKPPSRVTFQDIFSMGLFIVLLSVVVFLGWNLVQALLTKVGS